MGRRPRVITVMVKTDIHDHFLYRVKMRELETLLLALDYAPVYRMIQVRRKPTVDYVIGRGKLEELKEKVREIEPEAVVFYNNLTSKQRWNLERALRVDVMDRYDVTLMIFREAASDVLSKLQIQLAELSRAFPYIRLAAAMKFLRGRAGYLAGGEYAYRRQVNAVQRRIKILKRKIEALKKRKEDYILKKIEEGGKIVVISGYYNAGKTSLFNALTGMNKPVSPKPFTTLSSKYAGLFGGRIYLVDTIGFVLDLDPSLIESFQLNLLDIAYSSLVLLVVDSSDSPELARLKLEEAVRILERLGKKRKDILLVLNKVDLIDGERLSDLKTVLHDFVSEMPYVEVSAKTGVGLDSLVEEMRTLLGERREPS